MFSTGLASLLYEVVLISVISMLVGITEVSTSIVISSFLGGLAIGALIGGKLSEKEGKIRLFLISIELAIALCGFSYLFIFAWLKELSLPFSQLFLVLLLLLLIPTSLMGMEIPLAVKALSKKKEKVGSDVGFVYFADTFGGVIGSFGAGLLFIPLLGFQGSMFFGASLNVLTAVFAARIGKKISKAFIFITTLIFIIISLFFLFSTPQLQRLNLNFVNDFYATETIETVSSQYQLITIAYSPYYGNSLYLDQELQITERDSLAYHEYLVLPALSSHQNPKKALVIGGGDGGALYQLLQQNISEIDHVDLDEKVIELSKKYLKNIHHGSLGDKRVKRHIEDGRKFLETTQSETYDIIIIDLPDPLKIQLAPLYSEEFYQLVKKALKKDGIMTTQAMSPYYYLEGHATIYKTIASIFPNTASYSVPLSAMSSMGYVIASPSIDVKKVNNKNEIKGKWYNQKNHENLFIQPLFFEKYLNNNTLQISTDSNPIIVTYSQSQYYGYGIGDDVVS